MGIFSFLTWRKKSNDADKIREASEQLAKIQAQIFESALPPERLSAYFSDATDAYADVITQESTLQEMRANSRKVYLNEGCTNHGAFISGIHATGGKGPSLRIISAKEKGRRGSDPTAPELSEEEREHIEWEWYYFSQAIDLTENIRQAVEALQYDGELFFRMVTDEEIPQAKFNIEQIEAKRVRYPMEGAWRENVVSGIEFEGLHPKCYFVVPKTLNPSMDWNWQAFQVPAEDMIHFFISRLPDQHRGIPWMQSVLNDVAETNIYEQYHLGAANAAARNSGGVVECPVDGTTKITPKSTYISPNPGEIKQLLPGQTYKQLSATWPTSTYGPYIETKREKHAAGMQLTKAMLTNNFEKHNYSSFRGEMIVYWEVVKFIRQRIEKLILDKIFERFLACLAFRGNDEIAREILDKYEYRLNRIPRYWVWPPIPAYDLEAQIKALSGAKDAGFMSRKMCIEELGKDFEQVETDRKEDDFEPDESDGTIQPQ